MKHLCATRWSSRTKSFSAIVELYEPLVEFLTITQENDRTSASSTASGLLKKLKQFQFFFVIFLLNRIFRITHVLNEQLQAVDMNIVNVVDIAAVCIISLQTMKETPVFNDFLNDAKELALKANVDLPSIESENGMRKRKRISVQESYDPFLLFKTQHDETIDTIISDLQKRFEQRNIQPLLDIYNLLNDQSLRLDVKIALFIYKDVICFNALSAELYIFYNLKTRKNLVTFSDIVNEFKLSFKSCFPQLSILLKIFLSVPISSASCERAFSCMKRLKTDLRSSMTQERVSSCAILNIEMENLYKLNLNETIDSFANQKNRRIKFLE